MAALRSPFYGENLNLVLLRKKIEALDYAPLPANIYSHEVRHSARFFVDDRSRFVFQLRHLVASCLVLNPDQRPFITEVNQVAQLMYARFVEQANAANVTPTPTASSRTDSACGSVTPVNHR